MAENSGAGKTGAGKAATENTGAEVIGAEMNGATMRAVTMREPGGPDVLEVREVERPRPEREEVLVRVSGSGVNRADLLQRRGRYPAPPGSPADIPGLEYAGTVAETGSGCRLREVGDRVMGIVGGGGYAEYLTVHERATVGVPAGLDLEPAGGVPEVFLTAFDALLLQAGLAAGETLLAHAAGSGVGTAALQIARAVGARTIGTSRTPGKLERAGDLGLDVAVLAGGEGRRGESGGTDSPEGGSGGPGSARGAVGRSAGRSPPAWASEVWDRTGGRGVDVILDLVGAAYAEGNLHCLAEGGRWVVVGVPSGTRADVDLRTLMVKRARILGTVLRARPLEEKIALARSFEERMAPLFEDGRLRPVIDRVLPPERAAEAHRLLEENRTFGKVVLAWDASGRS